jgi:acylphosphatase
MIKNKIITVTGRVQNVGFRYYTNQAARKYNISGFVKNQSDGSVYIEAEGEEGNLDIFIEWCKNGPTWARINNVIVNDGTIMNYSGFFVK